MPRKSKKTQDKSASATSETVLAQNRTEQNRTEENRTEHNTTDETREPKTPDARQNGVVVCVDFKTSQTEELDQESEIPGKNLIDAKTGIDADKSGSAFTLEDCLRYVHLCEIKGDTIKNPQGLAHHLFKTGDADVFIRAALFPAAQAAAERKIYGEPVQFTDEPCSVCFGAKMADADGKGYRKCVHCKDERGKSTGFEPQGENEQ